MLLLGQASLLAPLYNSPDELAHVDMSLSVLKASGYPRPAERQISERTIASRNLLGYDKTAYDRQAVDAPPRPRLPFVDLRADVPSSELNVASQHPPVYYATTGVVTGLATTVLGLFGTVSHDQTVLLMRLFNVLLILPLPLLGALTIRRLGGSAWQGIAAGATLLTIPQLYYIGGSVNNDNGTVLAYGVLTYLLTKVVTGDKSSRTAVFVGVVSALGSLSKAFGLATIPWIVATYALTWWRRPEDRAGVVRSGAVATSIAAVAGGFWYARNLVLDGRLQPLINDRRPRPGFEPSFTDWLGGYPRRLIQSFWGDFGYLDVPIPGFVVVLATAALVILIAFSIARRQVDLRGRLVLVMPVLLVVGGNALQHWSTIYPRAGGFAGSQGRYLFGIVVPSAVLVGLAVGRRWDVVGARALVGAALVMQWIGIATLLRGFWGAEEGLRGAVGAMLAWSALPAPVSGGLLVGTVAVALLLVGVVARPDRPLSEGGAPMPTRPVG